MVNKYEDDIKNLYQRLPAHRLSTEKRTQMWNEIAEHADNVESQSPRRRFPKNLWVVTAAVILAVIIFAPIFTRFSGGISGASLKKTIQQSDYFTNDKVLSEQKVNGKELVFSQRKNANHEQSSLNIRYLKRTLWGGWKVTKHGGGYGTSIKQAFYVFDASGPGQLSTFYGEIKDPYVRKLKVINQDGHSVPVKTFTVKQGEKRLWYALIDPSKSKKFQIVGLGKDDQPITTKHYQIRTGSYGSGSSTIAFTPAKALKKVIAKHPDFPAQPNQTTTVKKPTGGPSGSYANVDLQTTVSKEGIKMYIVTFTKDWHVKVNGTDVKSVWKYRVKPDRVQQLKIDDRDSLVQTLK